MSRLIFLLEELSMKVFLDALLPRFFPQLAFLCVPHEGKQDLEQSIPRKLKAWREPGARFIIVRDADAEDCEELKRRWAQLCEESGRPEALVRLACRELEAWYLGDPETLALAYEDAGLRSLGSRERFRNPDQVVRPSMALQQLVPAFQKVSGARRMGRALSR